MKFFFMQTTTVKTFRHVFLKLVDNVIHNHISKFPLTNVETFFSYFGRFFILLLSKNTSQMAS